MSQPIAIVTGSNRGLGKQIAVKKVSKKLNNTETRRELMRKTEDLMMK